MNPGQGGRGEKLLGKGAAEQNPFGDQKSTVERWKIFSVVGVALLLGTLALQSLRADPTPEPLGIGGKPASKPATLTARADKEAWIGEAAGRVKKIEDREQLLEQKVNELREEVRHKDEELRKGLKEKEQGRAERLAQLTPSAQGAARSTILPPPPTSALPPAPSGGQPLPVSTMPVPTQRYPQPPSAAGNPVGVNGQGAMPPYPGPPVNRIRVFTPEALAATPPPAPARYTIPTGTMMSVKLLTGLDAPGKSAGVGGEPHPVLMFVQDLSVLPNNVQMDMKECFILAEGIGDLSEERAKIRAQNLSCIKRDEQSAVDIKIKGVVTGEDGKIGMRGPIVQREGAIMAKALMAGFVRGISQIFMPYQQGFFIAPNPREAFKFPEPTSIGMAGAAGGMGGAAQILARHYSQLAKEIYPVIEIDAGREGTLIITKGRTLPEPPL